MDFLIWALAGWCGTPYPIKFWPGTSPTPPPPDPWVPWKIAGIVGGIGLGFAVTHYGGLADSNPMPGIVAAIIGGRVLGDIAGRLFTR